MGLTCAVCVCNVCSGIPPPDLAWYKDGRHVTSLGDARVTIVSDSQHGEYTLCIRNARADDMGDYMVHIQNAFGTQKLAVAVTQASETCVLDTDSSVRNMNKMHQEECTNVNSAAVPEEVYASTSQPISDVLCVDASTVQFDGIERTKTDVNVEDKVMKEELTETVHSLAETKQLPESHAPEIGRVGYRARTSCAAGLRSWHCACPAPA